MRKVLVLDLKLGNNIIGYQDLGIDQFFVFYYKLRKLKNP